LVQNRVTIVRARDKSGIVALSPLFVVAKAYESAAYGKAPRLDRQGQVALSVALSLGGRNCVFLNHARAV